MSSEPRPIRPLAVGAIIDRGSLSKEAERRFDQLWLLLVQGVMTGTSVLALRFFFTGPAEKGWRPEFDGIRVGRLNRATGQLMVSISVPREVSSREDPTPGLVRLAAEAVAIAEDRYQRAGLPFPSAEIHRRLDLARAEFGDERGDASTVDDEPAADEAETGALFAVRFGGLASASDVVAVLDRSADLMERLDLVDGVEVDGNEVSAEEVAVFVEVRPDVVARLRDILDPACAEAGMPPYEIEPVG